MRERATMRTFVRTLRLTRCGAVRQRCPSARAKLYKLSTIPMASSQLDFGTVLRRHRRARGLTQEALAERARLSRDAISALERSRRRTPRPDTLALLADALELADPERASFAAAARQAQVSDVDSAILATLNNLP